MNFSTSWREETPWLRKNLDKNGDSEGDGVEKLSPIFEMENELISVESLIALERGTIQRSRHVCRYEVYFL
jgi:hypothetical protein